MGPTLPHGLLISGHHLVSAARANSCGGRAERMLSTPENAGKWSPKKLLRGGRRGRKVEGREQRRSGRKSVYFHVQSWINDIATDEPDPAAANALQEGLGGQFGEMRTMMQYLFQSINFRGPSGKPFRDLLQGIGTEEISHVELIGTTISRLLDGSPGYQGKPTDPLDTPGAGGDTPLKIALHESNIHHYLVAAQGALPVDAAGNPWSGSYVYNSGNLVLDLLYNLMLESTGRLQKCRIYEMTDNKTARSTVSYLIVRDQAHENAYAKALEVLGVDWRKVLPIPKTNAEKFPEVKDLLDLGLQSKQYTFDLAGQSEAGKIFRGMSPSNDGTELIADEQAPQGVPSTIAPERFEEFSPGLDPELLALIQAAADIEAADVSASFGPVASTDAKKK
jgi:Mn-containing catalase